jgi:AcrR family transcriptional regulator
MDDIIVNKKQTDILAAAEKLFWKYGFKKVSIEEMCREAKVSKVTFYKFFPNKTEVAKAVLDSVVDNANKDFILLIETVTTTSELMEGMFKMKKDGIHDISKEFLADFYTDKTLGLSEYIGLKIQQIWTQMREGFIQLQEKGLIRKDLNLDFLLYFSKKISDYFEDPYLLALFPNAEDLIMEFTNLFTFGMTPRPIDQ